MPAHVHTHGHTRTRTLTHIHTHIHTYIYIYIYVLSTTREKDLELSFYRLFLVYECHYGGWWLFNKFPKSPILRPENMNLWPSLIISDNTHLLRVWLRHRLWDVLYDEWIIWMRLFFMCIWRWTGTCYESLTMTNEGGKYTHSSRKILNNYEVKLAAVVEGHQKAPFSVATTPKGKGVCYSFPLIAPLYPWYVPYTAEC